MMSTTGLAMSLIGQQSAGSSAAAGRNGANRAAGQGGATMTATRVRTGLRGMTTEMNRHVFECYDKQSNRRQYAKTLEALEAHVRKVLKFLEDLASLFADTMEALTLVEPAEPDKDAGQFAETIYLERIEQFGVAKVNCWAIWQPCMQLFGDNAANP